MDGASKPHLLVLTSTYPRWVDDPEPGFVHELAKRLVADFDVTVLAPHTRGAKAEEDVDSVAVRRYRYAPASWETLVNDGGMVVNLRRNPLKWLLVPGFLLSQAWVARQLVRQKSVDVLHVHWLVPQGLVLLLLRMSGCGTPCLVTSHGADLYSLRGPLLNALKRRIVRACAAMTVVSSAMRSEAERIGLRPPRLEVLPMGVDLQGRFVPDAAAGRSADHLLFVGRLVPKKGLTYLLDALPRVLARRPAVTLAIAGFGPEEHSLRAQVQRQGLEAKVEFLGARPQSELPALYRSANLFVAPFVRDAAGDQEGLPVALMEAIACGCPVVAGDVAGLEDLLGAASGDIRVNPRDDAALAAAILAALDNPLVARIRALELRQAVAQRMDWAVIAAGYAGLLKDCMRISGKAEQGS